MTLVIIIVGFVMLTVGVAMLILGETAFLGKRIPAKRARLIGSIFVLFLPLALGIHQASNAVFGSNVVHGLICTCGMFGICMLGSSVILFRVFVPKEEPILWLGPEDEVDPKKVSAKRPTY